MRKTAHLLILVAALVVIATACDDSGPGGTVIAVFDCMKNKDYDKAVEYIHFNTNDEAELKERRVQAESLYRAGFEEMVRHRGNIEEVIIIDEQIAPDGKTATVSFKVKFTNHDEEEPGDQTLINHDGRWFYPDPLESGPTLAL